MLNKKIEREQSEIPPGEQKRSIRSDAIRLSGHKGIEPGVEKRGRGVRECDSSWKIRQSRRILTTSRGWRTGGPEDQGGGGQKGGDGRETARSSVKVSPRVKVGGRVEGVARSQGCHT